MLKYIRVKSKEELTSGIKQYFIEINEEPVIFHEKDKSQPAVGRLNLTLIY